MHEISPSVAYIAGGSDEDLRRIYLGYKQCYADDKKMEDLIKSGFEYDSPEDMEKFIVKIMAGGHVSPLEHASITFHVICSRACSHQLVRHRLASYSQQSQRYVKMDDIPVIIPESLKQDRDAKNFFFLHLKEAEACYKGAIKNGIPAEDARAMLPNCTGTELVLTMNYRELLHFFNERCCNRAQWEIRGIANDMLRIAHWCHPLLFKDAGPKCMTMKRCPELKPCGKQPWKQA